MRQRVEGKYQVALEFCVSFQFPCPGPGSVSLSESTNPFNHRLGLCSQVLDTKHLAATAISVMSVVYVVFCDFGSSGQDTEAMISYIHINVKVS